MIEPLLREGQVLFERGEFEAALFYFQSALGQKPAWPPALFGAAQVLNALGRAEEALALFNKLQNLDAKSSDACHGAGEALQQLGRIAEARQAFERAVTLKPSHVHHHYALAQLSRFAPGDARLAPLEALAKNMPSLSVPERGELHFALGKAYDDLGRWQDAFAQFQAGNALRRRSLDYDEKAALGLMAAMQEAFTPQAIAGHAGQGHASDIPVFVIGMPRSGTTLVEQILASHPAVAGAGETMYLHLLLGQGLLGSDFPAGLTRLKGSDLFRFGGFYAARLKSHAPAARRIVDKLPANFLLAGLIHLVLPKARLIHIRRDPLDTCLSCYANLFAENIDYAYDLGELGRYYRGYQALMAHWRGVLPPGVILEVDYETLVGDLETEARRLIAHCGLDWDPACLAFHQTARVVHTLSSAQVRRPLYQNAIGRAAGYAPFLGPLREALG